MLGIAFAGIGMFGVSFADTAAGIGRFGVSLADTAATTDKGLTLKDEWVQGIGVAGTKGNPDPNASQEPQLLKIIKNTINIVLGFLGLITLILLLRGGFQMVTANGDDKKFGTGQTVLKQAAMGL